MLTSYDEEVKMLAKKGEMLVNKLWGASVAFEQVVREAKNARVRRTNIFEHKDMEDLIREMSRVASMLRRIEIKNEVETEVKGN